MKKIIIIMAMACILMGCTSNNNTVCPEASASEIDSLVCDSDSIVVASPDSVVMDSIL